MSRELREALERVARIVEGEEQLSENQLPLARTFVEALFRRLGATGPLCPLCEG